MMGPTPSASANRVYVRARVSRLSRASRVSRVCRVWKVARSTSYHQRSLPADRQVLRPGPIGAAADAVLTAEIRDVIETAPFYDGCYRKLRACLRPGACGQPQDACAG